MSRDLDGGAAGLDLHDDGMVAESLDLVGACRTLLIQAVGGREFLAEEERRFVQTTTSRTQRPVPAPPLRSKSVDLANSVYLPNVSVTRTAPWPE